MQYNHKIIPSPVGKLTLIADGKNLCAILWENDSPNHIKTGILELSNQDPILLETEKQLNEYFSNKRKTFKLPLKFHGTNFQQKVWTALKAIPYGKTISYSEIATKIGSPKTSRAVGAAVGQNPISIVVPCHRVIGKTGALTGFAGGLKAKKFLLDLEK